MDTDSSESHVIPIPEFIQGVIESARNQPNADMALLKVLEKHILTDSPAIGVVQAAVKEIQALAEKRAQPSTENEGAEECRVR